MKIDVHQHIWTEPLLAELATRQAMPFARTSGGVTTVHCRGERPYPVEDLRSAPHRRAQLVREDGLDLAVIALSSPVGIEALPREEARELIEAHLRGMSGLSASFAIWGPVALDDPDPDDVVDLAARGCVGISLPAGALGGPASLHALGPLLERVAERGMPLLVHPGPSPERMPSDACLEEPPWWRGLTDYISQMQSAWLTFVTAGRHEHPKVTVVFAMLAGCAPLLAERLAARGGPPVDLHDPRVFYDTSSFGASAIAAMARCVGASQLVFGSDRPVVEPTRTTRDVFLQANGARLLALTAAPDG